MRVLYLIDSLIAGGAEQSLVTMAPHLVARGIHLDVGYLHDRPGLQDELRRAGAGLFPLAGSGGRIGWIRRARRLALERRPELIHTTLFEADVTGRITAVLAGVPAVSSLVNVRYGPEQLETPTFVPWKVRGANLLDAATARAVRRFHALTSHVAEVMGRRLRISRERIEVIPRGRDPDRLGVRTPERRAAARAALGLPGSEPLVLVAARQEYQKGLDVLLEAFPLVLRELPEARLVVAGREGNQTAALQESVTRLEIGDAVRFLGFRRDVPELFCGADVFVLPSRWEGLGSVLLEAMALESPIVASDLPPIRDLVSDGSSARLVPRGRSDALAAAIVGTLADPDGSVAQARCARAQFLEHFTIERVTDAMVAFYERALESR